MFYVKTKLNDSIEIKVDLYEGEIFTACPKCGKEIQLESTDIIQIFQDGGDFASTSFYCHECSKIMHSSNNKLVVIK
ncbi:hypothetical protein [Rummeliibacillus sp. POC4]|uniref:hypothetical protein n=1 Tax=Rummeliibacillus sp. POC4 TaxID=2305899 RepID=UPI000E662B11|nr:hypothetical protein [Rummeliibacillus sp. POC4]RIJ64129.1 hypothetical protein D1606_11750 [Rummeliibacillus sp. POC4]